jgi:hypothetical protein
MDSQGVATYMQCSPSWVFPEYPKYRLDCTLGGYCGRAWNRPEVNMDCGSAER